MNAAPDLSRLYRAVIEPGDAGRPERIAFVEAASHNCAAKKLCAVVAGLEHRHPSQVVNRIYNVASAPELLQEGLSEDEELRLMETGASGGMPLYAREPLFLVSRPAALIRIWRRCPLRVPEDEPDSVRERALALQLKWRYEHPQPSEFPRSAEYRAGAIATCEFIVHGTPVRCPFPVASAQHDAFLCGADTALAMVRPR